MVKEGWKTPGELAVSKCMECDTFFSAVSLWVGRQEGHLACKKVGVGLLVVTFGWNFACLSSSCYHHLHHP